MFKKKLAILIITGSVIALGLGGFKVYDIYSTNKAVKEFKVYISNYKNQIKNYTLEKDQQEIYKNLMTKADQVVNLNCKSYIDTLENELINFDKLIKESNIRNSKKDFNKVTNIDISNLDKKTQEKINTLKQETQKYISSKQFAIAEQKITEINKLINQENNLKIPNIAGRYLYTVLNKYGVELANENITISTIKNNTCTFEGGSNFLQHGDGPNGQMIPPEEVTQEMCNNGNVLARGGSRWGKLKYLGNGIWKGFIYSDQASDNNNGDPDNPKTPCLLEVNGNKAMLTFSDKAINYIKH